MAKELKDKIQAMEAVVGRLFFKDVQLTDAKNENSKLLQLKINELEKLSKEK